MVLIAVGWAGVAALRVAVTEASPPADAPTGQLGQQDHALDAVVLQKVHVPAAAACGVARGQYSYMRERQSGCMGCGGGVWVCGYSHPR